MYRNAVRGNIVEAITVLVKEMENLSLEFEHEVFIKKKVKQGFLKTRGLM